MDIHDSDEHIGLVAQEVQKVIPEAVSKNEKGYLLVNNDPIIWTMLNAIKEQQQQIRSQRARTRAQDAAIRTLQSQLKETRETLRKVTTQLETSHAPLLASK
jgi:septal ring factor EnvC (AmiA/AmiB activator)